MIPRKLVPHPTQRFADFHSDEAGRMVTPRNPYPQPRQFMDSHFRVLGIDYGTKRVGLALSDPMRVIARSIGAYPPDRVIQRLWELYEDPGFDRIVVGWPLTLSGDEGASTEFVRPFVRLLGSRFPSVTVIKWDERFSSVRAKEILLQAGLGRKARRAKGRVDTAAAAVILQDYLDASSHDVGGSSRDLDA